MKATCIIGSPHKNGCTGFIIDTICSGMDSVGIGFKKYCISQCNIEYCIGCKKCYIDGQCFQNDDVLPMVKSMFSSDFVILAAPSYWAGVPGQLKTFIDRCTPFADTNPERALFPKGEPKGIAIAVRAGKTEPENELILDSIEHFYGHLGIKTIKRISVCQSDNKELMLQNNPDIGKLAFSLGAGLCGVSV